MIGKTYHGELYSKKRERIPTTKEKRGFIYYYRSLFKYIKEDCRLRYIYSDYETFSDVIERIPYFIEDVYYKKRPHSSLGYWPSEEYERLLVKNSYREYLVC